MDAKLRKFIFFILKYTFTCESVNKLVICKQFAYKQFPRPSGVLQVFNTQPPISHLL
jgi:hypothetical protein